mgnify:CR=1 FL=1
MKNLIILTPFIIMIIGFIAHKQQEHIADVTTISDCVIQKWANWEDIRGSMPTMENERMFREECWKEMGATLNQGR